MKKINILIICLLIYVLAIAIYSWKTNPDQNMLSFGIILLVCFAIIILLRFVLIKKKKLLDKKKKEY